MAVVIRCDFCERIIEEYVTISFTILGLGKAQHPMGCTKQLCKDCSKKIIYMIEHGKEEMDDGK